MTGNKKEPGKEYDLNWGGPRISDKPRKPRRDKDPDRKRYMIRCSERERDIVKACLGVLRDTAYKCSGELETHRYSIRCTEKEKSLIDVYLDNLRSMSKEGKPTTQMFVVFDVIDYEDKGYPPRQGIVVDAEGTDEALRIAKERLARIAEKEKEKSRTTITNDKIIVVDRKTKETVRVYSGFECKRSRKSPSAAWEDLQEVNA